MTRRRRHSAYRHADQRDDSARSRASRGATSARRSRGSIPGRRRRSSSSTLSREQYETGASAPTTEARAACAVPRVPLQAAAEDRSAAGRCSSRRRRRRPKRCSSRASRTRASGIAAALDALGRGRLDLPEHRFRYRQAERQRRIHARRRNIRRIAGPAAASNHSPTFPPPEKEHQRVLRRRTESERPAAKSGSERSRDQDRTRSAEHNGRERSHTLKRFRESHEGARPSASAM